MSGKGRSQRCLELAQSGVFGGEWGPAGVAQSRVRIGAGYLDASGLVFLTGIQPSMPHQLSDQALHITVINYIRILVRTFDWLLARGHSRTSTTKERYKCDLKNRLQIPQTEKQPDKF